MSNATTRSTARVCSPRKKASGGLRAESRPPAVPIAPAWWRETPADGCPPRGLVRCQAESRSRARKSRFGHRSGPDSVHTRARPDSDPGLRSRDVLESLASSTASAGRDRPRTAPGDPSENVATARSKEAYTHANASTFSGEWVRLISVPFTPFVFYTEKIT